MVVMVNQEVMVKQDLLEKPVLKVIKENQVFLANRDKMEKTVFLERLVLLDQKDHEVLLALLENEV